MKDPCVQVQVNSIRIVLSLGVQNRRSSWLQANSIPLMDDSGTLYCVHSPKWAGSLLGARLGIRGMLGRTACCGVGACSPCKRRRRRVDSGQVIVSGWRMDSELSSLSRKDNDLNCGQIASARNAQNFAHSPLFSCRLSITRHSDRQDNDRMERRIVRPWQLC